MAHYDTYREELRKQYPDFGHALWEPNPLLNSPVEVGDVGFVREGSFLRLFNALQDGDHPSNQIFGVPEHHEPLPLHTHHIVRGNMNPTILGCSPITEASGGLQAGFDEING